MSPGPARAGRSAPGVPARGQEPACRILSLGVMRRCRPGRAVCLRLVWRAGARPPARVRYWIRVREIAEPEDHRPARRDRGGRTAAHGRGLARRSRPRCGRVVARLAVLAGADDVGDGPPGGRSGVRAYGPAAPHVS